MDLFAKRYEEGYDLFDVIYGYKNFIQQTLFKEESEKYFEEVTSREQTMYTEETFGWEEPTISR